MNLFRSADVEGSEGKNFTILKDMLKFKKATKKVQV